MKKRIVKKAKLKPKETGELIKLNLGCGLLKREGYSGADIRKSPVTDYVFDALKAPWPFRNESVETIFMSHFFEHFDGDGRATIMREAYRVLVMGGTIEVISPHWSSMRSIQDPTHKWPPLAEVSFLYYNQQWCRMNGVAHTGSEDGVYNFDFVYGHSMNQEWQAKNAELKTFAVAHYLNVAEDINVKLTKVPLLPPRVEATLREINKDGGVSDWKKAARK